MFAFVHAIVNPIHSSSLAELLESGVVGHGPSLTPKPPRECKEITRSALQEPQSSEKL
jgi:hypothetical protein